MRESDPLDWEKAGSDSTQSEGLGTGTGNALKNTAPTQNNKVIIATDNVENATVDNQENLEPDNRKEVKVKYFQFYGSMLINFKVTFKGEDV